MTANIASTIINAIARGYSARTILNYITRNNPQYSNVINNALAMGYTADAILKRISDKSGKNPDDTTDYLTDSEKTEKADKAAKRRAAIGVGAGAATLGSIGLGAAGLSARAASAASPALQIGSNPPLGPGPNSPGVQVLGGQPNQPLQPGPALGLQMQQQAQAPVQQAIQPTPPQQTAQAAQAPIPTPQPMQPTIPASKVLQDFGALNQVSNLLEKGTPPETVASILNSIWKGDKRKQFNQLLKSGQVKPLQELIKDFQQEQAQAIQLPYKPMQPQNEVAPNMDQENVVPNLMQEQAPFIQASGPIEQPEIEQPLQKELEPQKPIQSKSIVSTPQGVGEVKGISNGKAIVEIDGKAHKIDEKDIEPPIYSDEDIALAYNHLMKVIPEAHKSSWIQWAGYDEDRNALGFISKDGKYEELHNITPKEAALIKSGEGVARTSGETREGLWIIGEDTRGGVISQIIWDRKKKQQAEEEKQLKFDFMKNIKKPEKEKKGMQPIYSEMAYAREKSKERDKAIKLAEKERMKKEKDEAKKRKKQA